MTIEWITTSGSLGTITDQEFFIKNLEADGNGPITFSLLAGNLPEGLTLYHTRENGQPVTSIRGDPVSIRTADDNSFTSEFVIRASDRDGIGDRTFTITVNSDTTPQWITPSGVLSPNELNTVPTIKIKDNDPIVDNNARINYIETDDSNGITKISWLSPGQNFKNGDVITVTQDGATEFDVTLSYDLTNPDANTNNITSDGQLKELNFSTGQGGDFYENYWDQGTEVNIQLEAIDPTRENTLDYYIQTGDLPKGLTMDSNGKISGRISSHDRFQDFNFVVAVTNGLRTAYSGFTIRVSNLNRIKPWMITKHVDPIRTGSKWIQRFYGQTASKVASGTALSFDIDWISEDSTDFTFVSDDIEADNPDAWYCLLYSNDELTSTDPLKEYKFNIRPRQKVGAGMTDNVGDYQEEPYTLSVIGQDGNTITWE